MVFEGLTAGDLSPWLGAVPTTVTGPSGDILVREGHPREDCPYYISIRNIPCGTKWETIVRFICSQAPRSLEMTVSLNNMAKGKGWIRVMGATGFHVVRRILRDLPFRGQFLFDASRDYGQAQSAALVYRPWEQDGNMFLHTPEFPVPPPAAQEDDAKDLAWSHPAVFIPSMPNTPETEDLWRTMHDGQLPYLSHENYMDFDQPVRVPPVSSRQVRVHLGLRPRTDIADGCEFEGRESLIRERLQRPNAVEKVRLSPGYLVVTFTNRQDAIQAEWDLHVVLESVRVCLVTPILHRVRGTTDLRSQAHHHLYSHSQPRSPPPIPRPGSASPPHPRAPTNTPVSNSLPLPTTQYHHHHPTCSLLTQAIISARADADAESFVAPHPTGTHPVFVDTPPPSPPLGWRLSQPRSHWECAIQDDDSEDDMADDDDTHTVIEDEVMDNNTHPSPGESRPHTMGPRSGLASGGDNEQDKSPRRLHGYHMHHQEPNDYDDDDEATEEEAEVVVMKYVRPAKVTVRTTSFHATTPPRPIVRARAARSLG